MNTYFQSYNQQQNWLIQENHPVRIVNGIVEQLNLSLLVEEYSKEGKPSYHPKMMLQVMVALQQKIRRLVE